MRIAFHSQTLLMTLRQAVLLTEVKLPSEPVVRVVSSMIAPVEVSWVALEKGYDSLYLNFNFVLMDEKGEMHCPKDEVRNRCMCMCTLVNDLTPSVVRVKNRREMLLNNEAEIRAAQILTDVRTMSEKRGCLLSPSWWRQLGDEYMSQKMEAFLLRPNVSRRRGVGKQAAQENLHEIDCILEEKKTSGRAGAWFLVRWAGYQLEWEAWRIRGEPGSPIETWEPRSVVKNTLALVAWKQAQEQAANVQQ